MQRPAVRLVKPLLVLLALSACTESGRMAAPTHPAPQTPTDESLSDGASKIVAALRSRPDIDRICGGGEAFRDAMRGAVMNLVISGEIEGNPRKDAEAAADFLHAHCAQPEAAPESADGTSAWSGSR
ncbi:MAG TPA: hypothetical protein VKR31_06570 [Rhizomicrobium sp.]|nr:hypothetical protein [Rhizomicrobium sp.]